MIDLSHIYFAGEEPPDQIRAERFSKTKLTIRSAQKFCVTGLQKGSSPDRDSTKALSPLLTFVLRQSGLDPAAYRPNALNRRLTASLRVLRVHSDEAGISVLQRAPGLVDAVLSTLLIGVSEFFRDEEAFNYLQQIVLPQALEKHGAVRVYSAGCSAGQELYSVAMLLDEIGRLKSSHLVGVDCRPDAIAQARSGVFAASDLKALQEKRKQRHFRIKGQRAFISPHVVQRTVWHVADVGAFQAEKPWDLILFRNVAIYLETDHAGGIWHGLDRQLKPGGVVVTSSAERPPEDLRWQRESACIYRKALAPSS